MSGIWSIDWKENAWNFKSEVNVSSRAHATSNETISSSENLTDMNVAGAIEI